MLLHTFHHGRNRDTREVVNRGLRTQSLDDCLFADPWHLGFHSQRKCVSEFDEALPCTTCSMHLDVQKNCQLGTLFGNQATKVLLGQNIVYKWLNF